MTSRDQPPGARGGDGRSADELAASRRATFAHQVAAALKREFGPLWVAGDDPALPQADLVALRERVVELEAASARVTARLAAPRGDRPAIQAAIAAREAERLPALGQAAEALARQLRSQPAVAARRGIPAAAPRPAPGVGPASPGGRPAPPRPAATGGLTGMLQRLAERIAVATEEPSPPPPSAPTESPEERKRRLEFESAFEFAANVLGYMAPRVSLLEVSHAAAGAPAAHPPWPAVQADLDRLAAEAAIPPGSDGWLAPLARLFIANAEAWRRVAVTRTQWADAAARLAEARRLQDALADRTTSRGAALLKAFESTKFRGAAVPFIHLHVTFRGIPLLERLFPEPEQTAAYQARRPVWEG